MLHRCLNHVLNHVLTSNAALQEILGGIHVAAERYNAAFFEEFRAKNIVELAVDYARVS